MSKTNLPKRDVILGAAKEIFIEKGFRGTTISGIAEKAGIAKGSVYSYFDSKLDIVKALFLQIDESNQTLVDQLLDNSHKKRKELLEQFLVQELQQVLTERTFFQVFMSDELVVMNNDVMAVIQECRLNYHLSQQRVLLQAYSNDIKPWLYDIVAILNGLLQEYSVYLALDDANFSIKNCANLIAFCLDNNIQALSHAKREPLLTADNFPLTQNIDHKTRQHKKAEQLVIDMKHATEDLSQDHQKLANETLTLIEAELRQTSANLTLIRALIANLRPYKDLEIYRRRLADALDVELI
jgi:AcrR family transcriptional regulator